MTIDLKNTIANSFLDTYDTVAPAGSILEIRTGAPAGAENAAGGSLLCSITLPATPWAAASSGSKAKSGTWSANASGAGTAAHYRLTTAGGACIEEGTVTGTGSGGDLELDNTSLASGQTVTITSWTRTLA